ncbi:MAG: TetR/AcrR family transcriptional regulator [Deltaproteobacteria bacterium]|nr:TetR/AcrR family transcriptional regulator [Deltaproteobacteria bacterium]
MKPDETKARILAATDQLFGELGFDATTTRDIADRSGVNKALIHYHFGSKDELLVALLDDSYRRLTTALVGAMGKSTSLETQALDVLDAYADFLAANRTFCRIVQREVASGRHVERIVAGTLPSFQLGTEWLGQLGLDAPPGLELEQVLTSVYGMVVTYFTYGRVLEKLTGKDPFSPAALEARKRHVRAVVGLLFREMLKKPKARPAPRSKPKSRKKAR